MTDNETPSVEDRRFGGLVGLAVGDALGAAVEFRSPGFFDPVVGYRAGGPHGLAPGEWTDDTSMALALADSIAAVGWDLNDQARRYVDWWRNGAYSVNGRCFDIGMTVSGGLHQFEIAGDAATSGDSSERSAGNGSIMRLAPVPIAYLDLYPDRIDELVRLSVESSLPTHRAPQALSACAYFGVVLAALMAGEEREAVLDPAWPGLEAIDEAHLLHPTIGEVALGSFRHREPPEIVGSGYVVRSLEAALWAFHQASSFEEAVLAAVNLGDDADTTGAVCGQLAGAYWGRSGIPQNLLDGLAQRRVIEEAVQRLLVGVPPGPGSAADKIYCEECRAEVEPRHDYMTGHASDFVFHPTAEEVDAMAMEGVAEQAIDYNYYLDSMSPEELQAHMQSLKSKKKTD